MQTYPCFHCIEKDKRIAVLEYEVDMWRKHVVELEDALKVEADENMAYKQRIAELEAERNQVKCEVGVWLDGDQTPLKTLLNIQTILNVL